MAIESLVLYATSISASAVAVGAWIHEWRRDRHKPDVDQAQAHQVKADEDHLRATIKQMAEETNRSRDYRIWQLENYIDLDRLWHRDVIARFESLVSVFEELQKREVIPAGMSLPSIDFPVPPAVPEPPRG